MMRAIPRPGCAATNQPAFSNLMDEEKRVSGKERMASDKAFRSQGTASAGGFCPRVFALLASTT
jgi:hypothetical protein